MGRSSCARVCVLLTIATLVSIPRSTGTRHESSAHPAPPIDQPRVSAGIAGAARPRVGDYLRRRGQRLVLCARGADSDHARRAAEFPARAARQPVAASSFRPAAVDLRRGAPCRHHPARRQHADRRADRAACGLAAAISGGHRAQGRDRAGENGGTRRCAAVARRDCAGARRARSRRSAPRSGPLAEADRRGTAARRSARTHPLATATRAAGLLA
ncbi:conserved hypothetical protein, partial [Ricinus communis]